MDPTQLTKTFAALADPTRLSLLDMLAAGDATVGELARPFDLTQQAISKHLKVLEDAGLVSRRKAGQARPRRLEIESLGEALDWLEERRLQWIERHDRLEAYLATVSTTTADVRGSGVPND